MGPSLAAGPPDPFLGRDDLHATLTRLAGTGPTTGACPRVQLTHSVGTGGTAAAVAFAWSDELSAEPRFVDGRVYLSATEPTGHAPVPAHELQAAVLVELGYQATELPATPHQINALYQRKTRNARVLVVLDDAAAASTVAPLVPHSAQAMMVVVARRRLPLPEFRVLDVPPLSGEPARALLVCLLDRFGAPAAGLDEQTLTELLDICAGNPTLIHLVAGAISEDVTYAPRLIADARAHGIEAFRAEGGEGLIRALDLAYDGLTEPEQRAYRLLAVLPGAEFTVPAAAAVLGVDAEAAERTLHGLVRYNLVRTGGALGVPGRYRWHGPVREHARAVLLRVEPGPAREQARQRAVDWYRWAAVRELLHATDRWQVPADRWRAAGVVRPGPVTESWRAAAVDFLRTERDTLEAAVALAAEAGMAEAVTDLCLALWVPYHRGLPRAAALDCYRRGAEAAGALDRPATLMQLELQRAALLLAAGEPVAARDLLTEAVRLADRLGHHQGRQSGLEWLGKVAREMGDPAEALRLFERSAAVPVPPDQADRTRAVLALQTARALTDLHRYDEAAAAAGTAAAFFATTSDTDNRAKSGYEQGRALLAAGAAAPAADLLRQAAEGFAGDGSVRWAATAYSTLAQACRALGDAAAEDAALAAARPLYDQLYDEEATARVDRRRAELT